MSDAIIEMQISELFALFQSGLGLKKASVDKTYF